MKRIIASVLLVMMVFCAAAYGEESLDTLTYAVFPYLPDPDYYAELIEARWAEAEPDIQLVRADWNCYHDAAPEGIDVIIYDAVLRDSLIESEWIRPIDPDSIRDLEDIFPYALEGFTVGDDLYGIPLFLCGNFLIYDLDCGILAEAEHITDLAGESGLLVINCEDDGNREQYAIEIIADTLGEANPAIDSSAEEILQIIDRLAVDGHKQDKDPQVAMAYDAGLGQGYIGFSESMCRLTERIGRTGIKAISFSDRENTPRVYADAAAVTFGTEGLRYEKSMELINIMADAEVLAALSVKDGMPQYLLLPRRSPYALLAGQFLIYAQMEELAFNENNHVILTP